MRIPNYVKPATILCSGVVLSFIFLATPSRVLPHGGHDHGFREEGGANQVPGAIQVDAETAKRIAIKVEPVTRQRLAIRIKATGQIETLPNQKAEVTAPLNSTVVELLVNPGDAVRKGQAIAVISSPELVQLRVESQEKQAEGIADLQQAQADLNLAQQNYQQYAQIAAAEIAQALSQVAFAQEKYNRDRELVAAGALPRRNALESQTELAQAQAELTKATSRRDVLAAETQLKRAQSAVKVAQSRINLSNATYQTRLQQLATPANARGLVTVTAPISGTVADREVTLGQSFQDAGGKLMTIINNSRVFATANIYEKDLAQVQTNQRVTAQVTALPNHTFSGRITRIGSVVEGETRVVPVQAELDHVEGQLKPGMFTELEVLTDRTATSRLAIPSSAVVEANGQPLVYVQNGSAYLSVEVTLGEAFGDMIEVKSGLFEGDLIVTQRSPQLYAQSLRAGNTTTVSETPIQPQSQIQNPLPWWLVGVGGGVVIGTGAFMAGVWSSRRHQRRLAAINDNLATFNKHHHEPNTQIGQLESSLKNPSDF